MVINRFEKFVHPVPWSGCWIWSGSIHPEGYGRFGYKGKTQKAHRVSYELHRGEIPSGKLVCHACDEPSCVNPNHLFLGTNDDNQADKAKKGRAAKKLSLAKAMMIKQSLSRGAKIIDLAKEFGVTHTVIVNIKSGKIWKGV